MDLPDPLERLRARNPLPDGTLTVGAGLVVNGITSFAFLGLAGRTLGPEAFEPLSVLWAMIYLVGPGMFLPLEQETSRALANRWARGLGTGPLIRQAGFVGSMITAAVLVATAAAAAVLLDRFFDDQVLLLVGFVLAMIAYAAVHLARGLLAGLGRFRGYSAYYVAENLLRLAGCAVLAAVGAATAGPYGIVVGAAPFIALAIALAGEHDLESPGPPAPWTELSSAMGSLLVASSLTAFLLYAGPPTVALLSTSSTPEGEAGRFLAALAIARIPVFLFQAVQAALLPKLSALAGAGRFHEFKERLGRLLGAVGVIALAGVVGAYVLGPLVVGLLFGDAFTFGRADMALLAVSSGAFMLAVALGQALIALSGQGRVALGWAVGVAVYVLAVVLGDDLILRVEVGLAAGSAAAAAVIGAMAWTRLHRTLRAEPHTLTSLDHP